MKKFENILIVSDIDGTFLGKNGRKIARNLDAIAYFKANGGHFSVATGREFFLILHAIPEIAENCNAPVIACNGAYLYDFQRQAILREVFLNDALVFPIVQEIRQKFPESSVKISCGGSYYFEKRFRSAMYDLESFPDRVHIQPLETTPRGHWNKVLCDGEPEEIEAIHQFLLQHPSKEYEILMAHPCTVEIQPTDGTKGAMLPYLKKFLHLPAVQLYAIGDYENDISMLVHADFPACPANASPAVKAIPHILPLCDHDEGAIADLIEKLSEKISTEQPFGVF